MLKRDMLQRHTDDDGDHDDDVHEFHGMLKETEVLQ